MRIILQNQGTGLYLGKDGEWTEKREEARDFSSVTEAECFCRENELHAVALAVRGDSTYRLHLNCAGKR